MRTITNLVFLLMGVLIVSGCAGDSDSSLGIDGDFDHENAEAADDDTESEPDEEVVIAPDRADPPETVTVFEAGTDGYASFRIPVIVEAPDGALLAFCEGRVNSELDWGDIDLVMRRSMDGGRTWGDLIVLGNDGENMVNNPSAVVDRSSGTVFLLHTHGLGGDAEFLIREGWSTGKRTVWLMKSEDNGLTWSESIEISESVKPDTWRWYAVGPVHGIQMTRGPHAGRLLIPCNHSTDGGGGNEFLGAHAIYSDDHGRTWQLGAVDSQGEGEMNPNESTVVELNDGRLYFNSRNQGGQGEASRAVTYSSDGGETFDGLYAGDRQFVGPVVQGSVQRYGAIDQGYERNHLLFSSPGHPSERRDLTILSSFDEGETWESPAVIHEGPSAYSDIVVTQDRWIGVLYESGEEKTYERIVFTRFGVDWLLDQ